MNSSAFSILSLFFFLSTASLMAQNDPIVTDECEVAYDLGEAPSCPESTFFTNIGASPSMGLFLPPAMESDTPSCWPQIGNDVWVMFDVPADGSIVDFTVTISGEVDSAGNPGMVQPAVAVYRGECGINGLAELECFLADEGESFLEFDLEQLTPGLPIFLRVQEGFDAGALPGSFRVCVDTLQPDNFIDEGGSTACSGTLFDTGGPDGDYSSSETFEYSICPTTPNSCITFTIDNYNIEQGSDLLAFYDGEDAASGTLLLQISGFGNFGQPEVVSGGGGVCQQVRASSGCLTVVFESDGTNEFEGFAGSWECSSEPCSAPTPLEIDSNPEDDLLATTLSTAATVVTIDTIICANTAYGLYTGGDGSGLGLEKGLVMTSGSVGNVSQPATFFTSVNNNFPGDADLDFLSDTLSTGAASQDACIVEVDVFVASEELQFEYVFGSEEYPDFINSTTFVDIFALLISGPGINGSPNMNNQVNMAVLPNAAGTQVQITDVNHEQNWEFYRNNEFGQAANAVYGGLTSDFMGVKKSLTASYPVIPCNTYHLKFAIADRGDGSYDSGVFIGEIRGGAPDITLKSDKGVESLIEGCTGDKDSILIEVAGDIEEAIPYTVILGGSAIPNQDYLTTLINGQTIIFSPDNLIEKFPIIPISDGLSEGIDTITITLTREFDCGVFPVIEYEVYILDEPNVQINGGLDTATLCSDGELQLIATGAQLFAWSPDTLVSAADIANPFANMDTSGWLAVTGSFENLQFCTRTDSIFVEFIDPQMEILLPQGDSLCQGDTITLIAQNNLDDNNLIWTPTFSIVSDPTQATIQAAPTFSTTYTASTSLNGCVATATAFVNVDFIDLPILVADDTLICQGTELQLGQEIFFTSSTYEWNPPGALDDPTVADPVAIPEETTTFTVVTTGPSGFCIDTQSIVVNVTPAVVDIPEDQIFLCLGDSVVLSAATTNGLVSWTPDDGSLSATDELTVVATPTVTTIYKATTQVGICTPVDSVIVRVDSLPADLDIQVFPFSDPYCPGDTVTLFSENYDPDNFPDAQFQWSPATGILTDLGNFNILFVTSDTITYQRILTNNACADTTDILIPVFNPPPLMFNLSDTAVCPGQPVQLELLEGDNPFWSGPGLSCLTCLDPVATPPSEPDVTTYSVYAEFNGCGATGSVSVSIIRDTFELEVPFTDTTICFGDAIDLFVSGGDASQYMWSPDIDLDCNDCPDPVASPADTTELLISGTVDGCPAFATMVINVPAPPLLELFTEPADTSLFSGDILEVFAETTPFQPEALSWTLNGEDVAEGTDLVELLMTFIGLNTVAATITDQNGCQISAYYNVDVLAPQIRVPDIFTPNGDNTNDEFLPVYTGNYQNYHLRIYNRWGELVFESFDLETGWDGTVNGKPAPQDVYAVMIEIEQPDGTALPPFQQELTLVR
jgi:gliding motility-associated-like protein